MVESNIDKPIFIIGMPRSGTTLLYGLLAQHEDLAWFSKKTFLDILSPEFKNFFYIRRRIFEMRGFPYPRMAFDYAMFNSNNPPVEMGFAYTQAFPGNWDEKIAETKLEILKTMITETIRKDTRKRFLSKTPFNSIRIGVLKKAFPDCKFIHIVRNPVAVVNSLLKRSVENPSGYIGIPLKSGNYENLTSLQKHALQWKQVIEDIMETKKEAGSDFFQVKYEDLVSLPEKYLDEITDFCELPSFDYVFIKNGEFHNEKKKDLLVKRSLPIQSIENKNKVYGNEEEILETVSPTHKIFGY